MYGTFKFDNEAIFDALKQDNNLGFCTNCGTEHDGCEPDAEDYECDECEKMAVYGLDNILLNMV